MVKIAFRTQCLAVISSMAFVGMASAQTPSAEGQQQQGSGPQQGAGPLQDVGPLRGTGPLQDAGPLQGTGKLQGAGPLQGAAPIQAVGPLPTRDSLPPPAPTAFVNAPPVYPASTKAGTLDELLAQILGGPNPPDPQLLASLVGTLTLPHEPPITSDPPGLPPVAGPPPTYSPPPVINSPVVLPPPSYETPKQAQVSPSQ